MRYTGDEPILCKRPSQLLPKAIGEAYVFNFFGASNQLAVITASGVVYFAYERDGRMELKNEEGSAVNKGPVHRYVTQHLDALIAGAVPARLSCVAARHKRS